MLFFSWALGTLTWVYPSTKPAMLLWKVSSWLPVQQGLQPAWSQPQDSDVLLHKGV